MLCLRLGLCAGPPEPTGNFRHAHLVCRAAAWLDHGSLDERYGPETPMQCPSAGDRSH